MHRLYAVFQNGQSRCVLIRGPAKMVDLKHKCIDFSRFSAGILLFCHRRGPISAVRLDARLHFDRVQGDLV